jgi:broad specificity phosphatase PhoE
VAAEADRYAGSSDVALSDVGRTQAARLGDRLRGLSVDAVYCSPLSRAQDTARLILDGREPQIRTVDDLREVDHGQWECRTRDELERDHGSEYRRWESNPFQFAPLGGESGLEVLRRSLPAALEIVDRHRGGRVLVVSHKATLRLLLCSWLGIDPAGYRDRLDLSPCGLTVLDVDESGRGRLLLYNDVSHYASGPP